MNSEMEIVIAFLFKRSGKKELTESEIYLPLSIELGWYSTKESHDFIKLGLKQKLLIKKDEVLYPNFDIEKINIPIGFYPSRKSVDKGFKLEKENSIIERIVNHIVEKKGQDYNVIVEKIKKVAMEKNIIQEVAALFVAKQHNIDIEGYIEIIEKNIFTGNEE
jgi:hypothetical protein